MFRSRNHRWEDGLGEYFRTEESKLCFGFGHMAVCITLEHARSINLCEPDIKYWQAVGSSAEEQLC